MHNNTSSMPEKIIVSINIDKVELAQDLITEDLRKEVLPVKVLILPSHQENAT